MALLFAANRWGSGEGIFNYEAEAQALLHTMLHKGDGGGAVTGMFNRQATAGRLRAARRRRARSPIPPTNYPPSTALGALGAEGRGPSGPTAAATSRAFFHRAADPHTGLMPDYAELRRHAAPAGAGIEDFRYRRLAHARQRRPRPCLVCRRRPLAGGAEQPGAGVPRPRRDPGCPEPVHARWPAAVRRPRPAGLDADGRGGRPRRRPGTGPAVCERLWRMEIPAGEYRYYDGMLYLLGLLQAGGRFQIYAPPAGR